MNERMIPTIEKLFAVGRILNANGRSISQYLNNPSSQFLSQQQYFS